MVDEKTLRGKRLSVTLGPSSVEALEFASDGGARSYKDVIADALWLQEQIGRALRAGGSIILRYPNGQEAEILARVGHSSGRGEG